MERAAEAVRIEKERKESRLRANKERLAQLQATWKEDQQLKEVWLHSSIKAFILYTLQCLMGSQAFCAAHKPDPSVQGRSSPCVYAVPYCAIGQYE